MANISLEAQSYSTESGIDGGNAAAIEAPLLDGDAIENICRILECDPGEVRDARLLSGGLTNSSILLLVR